MKSILGFGIEEKPAPATADLVPQEPVQPVRSLVTVRFPEDGRSLTYYNDRFDLKEGDLVFVSGKLAGKPGVVQHVITRFKINLSNYQKIIAKAGSPIHGYFESVLDKMVSYDHAALSRGISLLDPASKVRGRTR